MFLQNVHRLRPLSTPASLPQASLICSLDHCSNLPTVSLFVPRTPLVILNPQPRWDPLEHRQILLFPCSKPSISSPSHLCSTSGHYHLLISAPTTDLLAHQLGFSHTGFLTVPRIDLGSHFCRFFFPLLRL